jgi:hypothetical protein
MMFAVVLTLNFLCRNGNLRTPTTASVTTEPSVSIPIIEIEAQEGDVEEDPSDRDQRRRKMWSRL